MHLKRELSSKVVDDSASMSSVADSIKRLALSQDGYPVTADHLRQNTHSSQISDGSDSQSVLGAPLRTVISNAKDDFNEKFQIIKEIGKGGFSVVYQCQDRQTGAYYAVKVRTK